MDETRKTKNENIRDRSGSIKVPYRIHYLSCLKAGLPLWAMGRSFAFRDCAVFRCVFRAKTQNTMAGRRMVKPGSTMW